MNLLVTAGNTQTLIDKVRCITNIFSGRTGSQIAAQAYDRGNTVTLLTSHPNILNELPSQRPRTKRGFVVKAYQTFDDLEQLMASTILSGQFDAIIHAAAVNDYHVVGTYSRDSEEGSFTDVSAGKVKSTHQDLWIRLQPAPKLVDKIRTDWCFTGTLVKFKLEVGATDAELLRIAECSRQHSDADYVVANTLEGMHDWVYLGSAGKKYVRVARTELAVSLIRMVEDSCCPRLRLMQCW
jgi:phosphopantothenate---cysteine ligase (CTP)